MSEHQTENLFLFDCQELGVKKTETEDPSKKFRHLYRYMTALTYATDLPAENRQIALDYGCGSGYGTEMLSLYFKKTVGVDSNLGAIAYAKKMHSRGESIYCTGAEWALHGPFDFITCIEVIEHMPIETAKHIIKVLHMALEPSGVLYITTPIATTNDGVNPQNPWHVHEWQPSELGDFLSELFHDVQIQEIIGAGPAMAAACKNPKE